MSSKHNIQQLILQHNRRLQKLKEKKAQYGSSIDPQVLIEIEDLEEKIGELRKESQSLEQDVNSTSNHDGGRRMGLSTKQIIALSFLAVIACIVLSGAVSVFWFYWVREESFSYLIRVQEESTGQNIANANVIIEVTGQAPLDGITDANGVARIFIPDSHSEEPARLLVEAERYESYRQEIDLTEVALLDTILLRASLIEPTPTDSIVSTQTIPPTKTSTRVVQVTITNSPEPSPSPTNIVISSPTKSPVSNGTNSISFGQVISGEITEATETDIYTFAAGINDLIVIRIARLNGDFCPQIRFYDPKRDSIKDIGSFPKCARIEITEELTQDGNYTIVVGDEFSSLTGEYNLHLQKIPSPLNPTEFDDTISISSGEVFPGTIDSATVTHLYTFEANADNVPIINIARLNGDFCPEIRLFDPDRKLLTRTGSFPGCTRAEINEKVSLDGKYIILVGDEFSVLTGEYNLSLQIIP